MCGNRVEELESRVDELEASVEGLTDELVECKVRLRELEGAVDEDLGPVSTGSDEGSVDDVSGDIDVEEPAEASNTEGANGEDNTEDSESDIIVA
jgi:hypothetical protein